MDEGLFARHANTLRKQTQTLEELVEIISKGTGILLNNNELTVSKKEVRLHVSSVKKSKLLQKNVQAILSAQGYTLRP